MESHSERIVKIWWLFAEFITKKQTKCLFFWNMVYRVIVIGIANARCHKEENYLIRFDSILETIRVNFIRMAAAK